MTEETPDGFTTLVAFTERFRDAEQKKDATEAKELTAWLLEGGLASLTKNLVARLKEVTGPVTHLVSAKGTSLYELSFWSHNKELGAHMKALQQPIAMLSTDTVAKLEERIGEVLKQELKLEFEPVVNVLRNGYVDRRVLLESTMIDLGVTTENNSFEVTQATYKLKVEYGSRGLVGQSYVVPCTQFTTLGTIANHALEAVGGKRDGWHHLVIGTATYLNRPTAGHVHYGGTYPVHRNNKRCILYTS
ncbi:Hypothetical protein POVN_LOCUS603 [uncultured virus]|nr:Hypothetical protein POVN_LOCUS603 [uncultured virus]